MFRIGEFSKLSKTTIKSLRYYDKVGLLKPAFVDPDTSYRYYTEEQLEILRRILIYKSIGLPNDEIVRLLGEESKGTAHTRETLLAHREALLETLSGIRTQISNLDRLLDPSEAPSYTATLKEIPACTVCYAQGYLSSPSNVRSFISAAHRAFRSANPQIPYAEPDYCCLIYPGEEYREKNVFVEYAQSVAYAGEEGKIVKFKELEAITAVSVEHRGNFDTLRDAYLFAVRWAAENGYQLCGNARERYIHGYWDRDSESEWLTEVQLPVVRCEGEGER